MQGPPSRAGLLAAIGGSTVVLAGLATAVSGTTFLTGETAIVQAVNDVPTVAGWPLLVVMLLGTLTVAVIVVIAVALRTRSRGPAPTLVAVLAVSVAYRLDNVLKAVIERPRPEGLVEDLHLREDVGDFGFPSGHTTMAFTLATALHPLLPARWRGTAWALAALVGLARMHVGVHWPADVVGGAALGIAIGSSAWLVGVSLDREREAKSAPRRR